MDIEETFIVESDPGERRLWRLTGWERIRFLVEDDSFEPHRDEALD